MIVEISITKKRTLIVGCIIISLLIHLTPLKMRLYTKQLFRLPSPNSSQQLPRPSITLERSVKPLMLTKQLPQKAPTDHVGTTNVPQQSLLPITSRPQIQTPTQLPAPMPQEAQPTTTHKLFRAGTGFDAPMNDFAITPARARPGKIGRQQATHEKTEPAPSVPTQTTPEPVLPIQTTQQQEPTRTVDMPTEQPRLVSGEAPSSPTNRLQLKMAGTQDTAAPVQEYEPISQHIGHKTPTDSQQATPSSYYKQTKGLSFLSQSNFEQMIRDQTSAEETGHAGTEAGYDGTFYGTSQVQSQYGDPRFLHYNSKIYRALQQSMDIVLSSLTAAVYRAAMDGIRYPTRIRFALDQDGQLISIAITRSSGNPRYDNLAYKIIQEASYPSIPKSFELHTTYHTYNILLYDVGPGPHANIGVSPYLEGE